MGIMQVQVIMVRNMTTMKIIITAIMRKNMQRVRRIRAFGGLRLLRGIRIVGFRVL